MILLVLSECSAHLFCLPQFFFSFLVNFGVTFSHQCHICTFVVTSTTIHSPPALLQETVTSESTPLSFHSDWILFLCFLLSSVSVTIRRQPANNDSDLNIPVTATCFFANRRKFSLHHQECDTICFFCTSARENAASVSHLIFLCNPTLCVCVWICLGPSIAATAQFPFQFSVFSVSEREEGWLLNNTIIVAIQDFANLPIIVHE